jgi:hypothetical protein
MKTLTTLLVCLFSLTGFAARPLISTSSADQLLPLYLELKDALVNSDAKVASTKAAEFAKALQAVKTEEFDTGQKKSFAGLKDKLTADAQRIGESKEIGKQREYFASLSANLLALAKTIKLSEQPVYQQYCPMKKASWLSSEKEIKNPYYGKQMLTCGQTKETI